jgi:chromosomal replication initiator protein
LVELLHTVDSLLRQKRQLVLAADRPPAEAIGAGSELAARLSAGLVCAIGPHEKDGRMEIARRFARQRGLEVPGDVLELIAERLPGDARQILGALNRVDASSRAHDRPITVELAEESLQDIFRTTRRVVRLADIDRAVCDVLGIAPQQLKAPRKARAAAGPRMLAMWLARKYTRAAYSEIGRHFGCRSHSTVISAQRKVSGWVDSGETIPLAAGNYRVGEALERIEAKLKAC